MTIRTTIATEINQLHSLACLRADEAVAHAKQAGLLLIEAKAGLKHGQWLPWLQQNIQVSPRQVQRYVQVAQGRELPIRLTAQRAIHTVKCDTLSYLEVDAPRSFPGDTESPPSFIPKYDRCYAHARPCGTVYLVEPSRKHHGCFFVSRLNSDESFDCTRRPVFGEWVEMNLQHFGLSEPSTAEWKVKASVGVITALKTFDGEMSDSTLPLPRASSKEKTSATEHGPLSLPRLSRFQPTH